MDRRQDITLAHRFTVILAASLLLAVTACTPGIAKSANGTTLPKVEPSPTATPFIPTITPTPQPTATPTPEPGCMDTTGYLEDFSNESKAIGKPLQFIVYTPPCYDPQAESPYPVLYMLHGQSFNQDQWVNLGMPYTADRLITAGELPPFLIVMPYEEYNLENPFETGYKKALIDELIPWVDAHYNTCTQRECRMVGGLSRGGSWALYLGVAHWELFGSIGAHSTAPFFGMDSWLGYFLGIMGKENFPRLFVDFGESDPLYAYMKEFQKKLDGYKLTYEFRLRPGNHTEEYWGSHVEEYLRWYWEGWSPSVVSTPTTAPEQ